MDKAERGDPLPRHWVKWRGPELDNLAPGQSLEGVKKNKKEELNVLETYKIKYDFLKTLQLK